MSPLKVDDIEAVGGKRGSAYQGVDSEAVGTYREQELFKLEKGLKLAGRGRPKGLPKTGGRKKGSVDKRKREAEIAASGLTPLDYLLGIVRAETPSGLDASVVIARETLRFEAAKAAAPYCHPRLQA